MPIKKAGKKVIEEAKSNENVELKELGFEAKNSKTENEFSDEVLVKAVVIKIKQLF